MLPKIAQYDDPLGLRVEGLPPGETCVVRLRATSATHGPWESEGRYVIGPDGVLDPSLLPSVGGSYEGVDDHGLLWSVRSDDDEMVSWLEVAIDVVCGERRETFKGLRTVRLFGIEETELTDGPLYGTLYTPKNRTGMPPVILLNGTGGDGKPPYYPATILAGHGFAALALRLWDKRNKALPSRYGRLPVEYVIDAAEWLTSRDDTADRVGIVAFSAAMPGACLAARGSDCVAAVVGFSGPTVAFGRNRPLSTRSSWTIGGRSIRGVTPSTRSMIRLIRRPGDAQQRWVVEDALGNANRKVGDLDLRTVKASILIAIGEADELIPPEAIAEPVLARGRPDDVILRYPDAGHLGHVPGLSSKPSSFRPFRFVSYSSGGTLGANGFAHRDSWRQAVGFLRRHLGPAEDVPRVETPTLAGPPKEREDDVSGRGST